MRGYSRLRDGRRSLPNQIYHVITVTVGRKPVFTNLCNARFVVGALRWEQQAGHVDSLAFVLMPDHLHWLMALRDESQLGRVVQRVKGHSARRVNCMNGRTGSVWQSGFYDRALRREEDVPGVARYLVANPIRAGLVDEIGQYPFWDCVWL